MKARVKHSILSCLAAFALPLMVACSRQEESLPEVGVNDILAIITLDLGDDAQGKTRATPTDGTYEKGNGWENTIDFDGRNFRCFLFGTDNKLVSTMEAVTISSEIDGKRQLRFRLEGTKEVKDALSTGCRFVFLANWGSYPETEPGVTTIEELCTASQSLFEFSQDKTQLSEKKLIPMYGVREFESGVQDFKDGKTFSDIGVLHLLRAYAKVEVNVTFEGFEDKPVITFVSLTHASGKGYKAPANVTKEEDYVTGSWFKDYTPVNIPDGATDIGELQLTKDEGTGHYVAYVPEYKNVEAGNPTKLKISFTIGDINNGGLNAVGYVDFMYSENPPEGVEAGQAFDIARNNWYKFNVVAKGKDIDWTVDVIPFTSVVLKPDMGLEREEFTGYIVGKDEKGNPCWYDVAENPNDPEKRTPYYLGPHDAIGNFVTINGKEYLLVYTDFERTAANLNHIFEKDTEKTLIKHLLTPEGITGYKGVKDGDNDWLAYYLNNLQQRVWLDDGGDPNGNADAQAVYEALKKVNLELRCCRILYEWDRLDFSKARWWEEKGIYPKYWFDILGNRYPWSEGDTKEKRKVKLGDWVKYLE